MIGKLKGIVDSISEDRVIIDVGGVGYLVFASGQMLRSLPSEGEGAEVIIETHVREDHIHLYGFLLEEERQWFRTLTKVNGVGTKMAMAILSAMKPVELAMAIIARDKAALTEISGVGPKLADRLLTELKNKAGVISAESEALPASDFTVVSTGTVDTASRDAISALVNLGYGRSSAYSIVTKIAGKQKTAGVEDLIRISLKELAS